MLMSKSHVYSLRELTQTTAIEARGLVIGNWYVHASAEMRLIETPSDKNQRFLQLQLGYQMFSNAKDRL
jgi:hypothetical protein